MRYPQAVCLLSFYCSFCLFSCDYRTGRNQESASTPETSQSDPGKENTTPSFYHIFLENSGSMDGYVRGITSFEDDLYKLLIDVSYLADSVQVSYINTRIIPYRGGIQNFINNLEPASFQERGGNRSSSNLNQILNQVLEEVDKEGVSMLISDYIFSAEGGNTAERLNNQKISIYNTFRSKLQQEPFATYIIKLNSEFNGNYYNKNDQPVNLQGVKRPYYVWLIGKQALLDQFKNQIRLNTLEGFENTYMLTTQTDELQPYFTVMNNFNKTGNFRTDRNFSGSDYVRGIQNVEAASRGEAEGQFGFAVAVDMSDIPVDQEYLTHTVNYQVNEAYSLESVQPTEVIKNINTRDFAVIEGKATHVLTFMAQGKSYPDLRFSLKKQTPAWVNATHTENDMNIKTDSTQQARTFGFGYLVGGVEEAYQNVFGGNTYFSIEVSVNK